MSVGGRPLQTKLTISEPGDVYEQEADRLADQVMRMSPADVSKRQNGNRAQPLVQRRASGGGAGLAEAPPIVHQVLNSPGQPLEPVLQQDMGQFFGYDFSGVRVHSGGAAEQSARDVGANAYTVGHNMVFGAGQFVPGTYQGRRLIAHELTHVVQQNMSSPKATASMPIMPVLRRQPVDNGQAASEELQLTRPQEIQLSRSSPGEYTGQSNPLTLSLYNYGIDIATPKAEHNTLLLELARFLNTTATVAVSVRAIGFADASGDERHNLRLSERRATAVQTILQPLITQRVSVSAYGETNPAVSNDTVSGRSRNRRVDLRFAVDRPQPPGPGPQPSGGDDDRNFCLEFPLICGMGISPFLLPLLCLVAPEVCSAVTCLLLPELCIPPVPPGPPKPPQPPDEHRPHVTFVPAVRADNTPSGMPDRVGLRDPVTVTAVVINPPPIGSPITIDIDGVGSNGGIATVNGAPQVQINATTPLEIRGTTMSAANFVFSPFLQLGAWWSNDLIGWSNRFAVSSVVEDWSVDLDGVDTTRFGHAFYTKMDWVSDSGAYRDLDECRYVERVELVEESGGMEGMGIGEVNDPEDVVTGDLHPTFDQHGTPHDFTRRAGHNRVKQLFSIRDMRSNSGWVASRNSGFEIDRLVERDATNARCWQLTVEKSGVAVSIGGWRSDAGSGRAVHTFHHLNCVPPPPAPSGPTPEPEPQPTPEPTPTPTPDPGPTILPCDRAELERRVDACIEQAKQDAIDCTLEVVWPPPLGWEGIERSVEYLDCIERLRARLLECDRQAKRDTHCEDGANDGPLLAQAAGIPPSET